MRSDVQLKMNDRTAAAYLSAPDGGGPGVLVLHAWWGLKPFFKQVCDLDKEDGTFHTDGTTDIHLGFDRAELQKQTEAAGFGEVTFSTPYVIRKEIKDGTEKEFPLFLMSARRK